MSYKGESNAVFHVVSYTLEFSFTYSWGLITTFNDGVYKFYLASPKEHSRIYAMHRVKHKFLGEFEQQHHLSFNASQIKKLDISDLTELSEPYDGFIVYLPEDVIDNLGDLSITNQVDSYLR